MYRFLFSQSFSQFLCCSLFFCVLSCAPGQATDERRAQLHLQIGTALLSKGNYPGALQELLTAEQLDPENSMIQNNLGLAYFVRQKYIEAEKHIKKALERSPQYTDAKNNLGRVYIEQGRYDLAISLLKKANEDLIYPFPDKTLTNLGIAYFNKGDFQKALDVLKKSLQIKRENCLTFNFYGRTLFELSDFSLAAEAFDQSIYLCKETKIEDPYYFSSLSFYKLGDKPRAIARLEELISLFPNGKYNDKAKAMLKMMR